MTGFLIDTNVISELRKKDRANSGVVEWFNAVDADQLYLSVLVLGEVRRRVELIRRRDMASAQVLEGWLVRLKREFADRILPVTEEISELWGQLGLENPVPPIDGLLAATAMYHDHTLVTRNTDHTETLPVKTLNPFR